MSSQNTLPDVLRCALRDRVRALDSHLEDVACGILREQRHLDGETSEHVYWHSGYRQALEDLLFALENPDGLRARLMFPSPMQSNRTLC